MHILYKTKERSARSDIDRGYGPAYHTIYNIYWVCCSLMSLVASDNEGLKNSLDILAKWCEEWGEGGGV